MSKKNESAKNISENFLFGKDDGLDIHTFMNMRSRIQTSDFSNALAHYEALRLIGKSINAKEIGSILKSISIGSGGKGRLEAVEVRKSMQPKTETIEIGTESEKIIVKKPTTRNE